MSFLFEEIQDSKTYIAQWLYNFELFQALALGF